MKYLLVIFIYLLSSFALAADNPYTASVVYVKGKAYIAAGNDEFGKMKKGDLLSKGDQVKTAKSSFAIIRFPDRSTMRIGPKSHINFESIVERVQGESFGSTSIYAKAGRMVIKVLNKSKAPVFKVKSKGVSIGVRGTNFFVGLNDEEEELDVAVKSGEVEVASLEGEAADALDAGQGMVIEKGQGFTQPKNYNWVDKINYDADDKSVDPDYFKGFLDDRKLEFRQKREEWKRDAKRWLSKKEAWKGRKKEYEAKLLKFKDKRSLFKKEKSKFLKKKLNFDKKRSRIFKRSKLLNKDVLDFKKQKAKLTEDYKNYKAGAPDPKKLADLKRRSKKLDLNKANLSKKIKNLKLKEVSMTKDRGSLLKKAKIPKDLFKNAVKNVTKKKKEELKRKVKKRAKKKVKRKVEKKLKNKIKDVFKF